ncbi:MULTISPECIES: type I-F CRISPR-associated protein Csy2 [Halorhodospira]|uniref:type I-F CRISPR-associated protein Csy2 n=1 Tax=Halorhodospira TaxID=85108 RepID=UPI001EE7AAF3|nr:MULTISPECIES: type I-F CRISPR-associated protein Csy2 [Halorhodospira]MCG5528049.1 type I-F CRISPR-associated protein Csy2 [Halorhodospira halophila]MCG5543079.1 type I-F CRISPR-associated protein Csy2 [Halorhodospira sp. 9628]
MHEIPYLLEIPRLRIQNANAISSPHTWGFPGMSAFVGLMHALERRLHAEGVELNLDSVGVICHRHEPQASRNGSVHALHLTRNPVGKKGDTAAIVEEGRTHLEITLVFAASGAGADAHKQGSGPDIEESIAEILPTLRVAGGTIQPPLNRRGTTPRPQLISVAETEEEQAKQARWLLRRWLPGFALLGRDDLLHDHHSELQKTDPQTDLLDAWLDLVRFNWAARSEGPEAGKEGKVHWERRGPARGWLVPIPVGYGALGPLHEAGAVAGARDDRTPFRFVESLYSIGEWKSPHRLESPAELLWYVDNQESDGLYRLRNDYARIID